VLQCVLQDVLQGGAVCVLLVLQGGLQCVLQDVLQWVQNSVLLQCHRCRVCSTVCCNVCCRVCCSAGCSVVPFACVAVLQCVMHCGAVSMLQAHSRFAGKLAHGI